MGKIEIILIAVGVAMDAFAASISKGLVTKKDTIKNGLKIALCFGIFQFMMPLYGYLLGNSFGEKIMAIDHWVAFFLLMLIGIGMIREKEDSEDKNENNDFKSLIILGIATSIDALAVGITFSLLKVKIMSSVIIIGLITFGLSFLGFMIGNSVGNKYKKISQIIGGMILIFIAIKTLIEHINVL